MNGSDLSEYACNGELSTHDIYSIALKFFKENKDKAFRPSYETKIKMTSLSNYIKYGDYKNVNISKGFGMFDVVGNDICRKWQSFAGMTIEDAEKEFVRTLESCCREFDGFLEAKFTEQVSLEQKRREQEEVERERQHQLEENMRLEKELRQGVQRENQRRIEQENKLRGMLNEKTLNQFREYAEQQYPNNKSEQEKLIAQLQQHHFHQYMLALYNRAAEVSVSTSAISSHNHVDEAAPQQVISPATDSMMDPLIIEQQDQQKSHAVSVPSTTVAFSATQSILNNSSIDISQHPKSGGPEQPNIAAAAAAAASLTTQGQMQSDCAPYSSTDTIWYSPDMIELWVSDEIAQFKAKFCQPDQQMQSKQDVQQGSDYILNVGSGEIVTIKVPVIWPPPKSANSDATQSTSEGSEEMEVDCIPEYLMWQFATDDNDIGFGLTVVQVDDEDDEAAGATKNVSSDNSKQQYPATELLPVVRRDSHLRVHAGRIRLLLPDNGSSNTNSEWQHRCCFMLRFDNSYSLWRQKKLYYRVFYSNWTATGHANLSCSLNDTDQQQQQQQP